MVEEVEGDGGADGSNMWKARISKWKWGVPVRYQCDLSQPLQSSVCHQFAAAGYFYYLTVLLSYDPLSVDSETIFLLLAFLFQNPLTFFLQTQASIYQKGRGLAR